MADRPNRPESAPRGPGSPWRQAWRRVRGDPRAVAGAAIIALLALAAMFAEVLAPYGYGVAHPGSEHVQPGGAFWLGTDTLARDILSRLIYGARISLLVGVGAMLLAGAIGVAVGLVAGTVGGWVDAALMRITDMFYAFPSILLALAIVAIMKTPHYGHLILAIGLVGWTGMARIVRGQAMTEKTRDYVQAAQALGAGPIRVMLRHVLPNCLAPIIVVATLQVGSAILIEAGLAFLGLSAGDMLSWGTMLADSREYLTVYPWMSIVPGLAIVVTVLAFNLLGDGLRDALDPRSR